MSAKEILLEVAEKLPASATLVDAIHELELRFAVEKNLAEQDKGKNIANHDVKAQIAALKHELQLGLDDLDSGNYKTYDEAGLMQLAEDIGREGRERLKQNTRK